MNRKPPYLITAGLLVLLLLGPAAYFLTKNPNPIKATWYDNNYNYRQTVTITYSGLALTNYNILIELDTAALIAAGKMQSDCDDIRAVDSDDSTSLKYWVEGGCNTTTTQIWVTVPSIPDGGKSIYLYYGNSSAGNGEELWSGNFILLNNADCPTGWTRNADFDSRFPYGDTTYGTTGGASTHSHANVTCTTGPPSTTDKFECKDGSVGGVAYVSDTHTHTAEVSVNSASNIPPYLDMVYCQNSSLDVAAGLIALYDADAPTGWTRFSALDSKFPQGALTYGGTGGATTHSHTTNGGFVTSYVTGAERDAGTGNSIANRHDHTTVDGNTDSSSHIPPYLNMVFASKDTTGSASVNTITMATAIPPMGWTRFSALDSKFPQGALTYGGTGGATTHTHSVTITTGPPDYTINVRVAYICAVSEINHTHSCTTTTDSGSNIPPYLTTIFIKKDSPVTTTSVGNEEVKPPDPPSVCVVEEDVDDAYLIVKWQDNSTNESGFEIERSVNGGAWSDLTTVSSNSTSYQDNSISQGNIYQYRIASYITSTPTNATSNWLYCPVLSIKSGSFKFEGLKLEGLLIN